jgi:hypothetical protein
MVQYRQRQRQKIERTRIPAPETVEVQSVILPSTRWIPIGPSVLCKGQAATQPPTSGRTVGISVAPGGERVYIATANGGVWYSEDTGQSWRSLMEAFDLNPLQDGSDSLACGAIALVPGETASQDRIYVGTGEGAGADYFGVGPIVSKNGGSSWIPEISIPDLAGSAFYALAIDPADADRVVGATRGNRLYRRETDGSGGFHWIQKNLPGAGSNWVGTDLLRGDERCKSSPCGHFRAFALN